MRAVFFCSTSASSFTRSTSTLTTSELNSGVGVGFGGSWIAPRLGRPMLALKFLLGVCEVTGLAEQKSKAAMTIDVIRIRGSRRDRRYLIIALIQMQVSTAELTCCRR